MMAASCNSTEGLFNQEYILVTQGTNCSLHPMPSCFKLKDLFTITSPFTIHWLNVSQRVTVGQPTPRAILTAFFRLPQPWSNSLPTLMCQMTSRNPQNIPSFILVSDHCSLPYFLASKVNSVPLCCTYHHDSVLVQIWMPIWHPLVLGLLVNQKQVLGFLEQREKCWPWCL